MALTLGPRELAPFDEGSSREWVVANGIGGYASSTALGADTRRYHGLLVAALEPPGRRCLLLVKLEEEVVVEGQRYPLSVNEYPGVLHPRGNEYLTAFHLDPDPIFLYRLGPLGVRKDVSMVQGHNATLVRYTAMGRFHQATLTLRPLVDARGPQGETHRRDDWTFPQQPRAHGTTVAAHPGAPPLDMVLEESRYKPDGLWYYNFIHRREAERGLPDREDHFSPGQFSIDLTPGETVEFIASAEGPLGPREASAPTSTKPHDPWAPLWEAAGTFLSRRGSTGTATILAGYHWFLDWGRDAMISLPGLCLATGRYDVAQGILRTFAAHMRRGLLPNRFPEEGEGAEYNSADASLWFVWALDQYRRATGDSALVTALWPRVEEVLLSYSRGTDFDIHMGSDGLIALSRSDVQLTWMDAKVGDWVVTPRTGRPVEINALWYNALRAADVLAPLVGRQAPLEGLAAKVERSFVGAFWREDLGYLLDVSGPPRDDEALRPNQILAVALPHSPLPREVAESLVQHVEAHLLTPMGLRTLAPGHPDYRGRYEGDQGSRDAAYHNGTVWPWLLGPYIDAFHRLHPTRLAGPFLGGLLQPLHCHLREAGLGTLSEIFDGDAPHRPRGCISQAWSVAEVLRVLRAYG